MKQNTLTVHSEEAEHVIEFPQGISSIDIDGVRLFRETSQIIRLVWMFGTCAIIGLISALYCGFTITYKINAIEETLDSHLVPLTEKYNPPKRRNS